MTFHFQIHQLGLLFLQGILEKKHCQRLLLLFSGKIQNPEKLLKGFELRELVYFQDQRLLVLRVSLFDGGQLLKAVRQLIF